MPFYRGPDGQTMMHLNFGRPKLAPLMCRAPRLETDNAKLSSICARPSTKLCDAVVGQDLGGRSLTCDMPICDQHATSAGRKVDYCPRHAHLAPDMTAGAQAHG